MARILVIPYGHALSHVSRPLALAEALREGGHDVVFAGGGKELAWAERRGFPVRQIAEIPHEVLFGRIRERKLRFIETDELSELVGADLVAFEAERPDLVLTDGRISARISAKIAGIRHAAVVNVSSTHHRAIPYVPFFEKVPLVQRLPLLQNFNRWAEMAAFDLSVPAFRAVARERRIEPEATATNCLEGNDLTLLPDSPDFMPSRGLPPGHYYIGPVTFRADIPDPPWWPRLLEFKALGRKVLYFTLGTTGARALFASACEAFAAWEEVAFVVTTGGQFETSGLPANVFTAGYLDGDRVMEVADVVVCHGGNGTVYQALAHGVPVVGIPTIPDQAYNMRMARRLGVGAVAPDALSRPVLEWALRWAVATRAAPRFADAVQRLRSARYLPGAAALIEALLARG